MLPEGRTQAAGRPDPRYDFPAVGGASRRHEQRLGADGQGDSRTAAKTLLFDVYKAMLLSCDAKRPPFHLRICCLSGCDGRVSAGQA